MTDTDRKQRFLFPHTDLRGEIVRLEASLAPVLEARPYPMAVRGLLGEALAAAVLLAGTLKFRGRLSLQAQGDGPVTLLLAECNHDGNIRGLARWREEPEPAEQPSLTEMLGEGIMAITIVPEQGRQYQGLVPLEDQSLATCLESYFRQSEQLPTRLWLASGNNRAAGMLLQSLPDQVASREENRDIWQHLNVIADSLTMEELLDLDTTTVLRRLFHETPPRLPPPSEIHFHCTCSRDRTREVLLSLGADELRDMLEQQGEARITCDFCGSVEVFDAVDLAELIRRLD